MINQSTKPTHSRRIYGALFLRTGLFAVIQAVIALIYFGFNIPNAWNNAAKWWIGTAYYLTPAF